MLSVITKKMLTTINTPLIKPYYVQTLCLLFFPGETFSPDEPEDGRPHVYVDASQEDMTFTTSVSASIDGRSDRLVQSDTLREDSDHERSLCAGRAIYRLLGRMLDFYPEWGILTGVRPSKLATSLYREGGSFDQAVTMYETDYLTTPAKARLAASAAKAESGIISSLEDDSCSVYVSVPFCPTRCAYCSFVSYSTPRLLSLIPQYLDRLCEDIDSAFDRIISLGLRVSSVYIGGGTPTILDPAQITRLLGCINRNLDRAGREIFREFTLEGGRPDTITRDKLAAAYQGGVDRISINPQSTDDEVLRGIGRSHTAQDFFSAYELAEKSGIKCINTDLIAGLPLDDLIKFTKTIDDILSLKPQNVTVHTFSVKRSSSLRESAFRENGTGVYSRRGGDAPACVSLAFERLCENGYHPYYMYRQKNTVGSLENVGYSLDGFEGLYNIFIMEEVHSIFACGAGAVSKTVVRDPLSGDGVKITRNASPKYPYEYLNIKNK